MATTVIVNAFLVVFGLLFLSASAPAALGEERVLGSLDVLLATPLSTRSIVLGKWWAAFRIVPRLAILPALGSILLAGSVPDVVVSRFNPDSIVITPIERVLMGVVPTAWIFAHGALIASVGLALAIGIRRPGRAIAASVALYILWTFGGLVVLEAIVIPLLFPAPIGPDSWGVRHAVEMGFASLSPYATQFACFEAIGRGGANIHRGLFWFMQLAFLTLTLALAAGILWLCVAIFNRCLGRVDEIPGDPPIRFVGGTATRNGLAGPEPGIVYVESSDLSRVN
jgi:hypothetical protein